MRRTLSALLGLVVVTTVACTVPSGSWTQYRNDPAGSGVGTSPGPITAANVSGLTLEFTGAHTTNPLSGAKRRPPTPVIAHGMVYIVDVGYLRAYDADGITNCSSSGVRACQPLWSATVYGRSDSVSAAVVGDTVVTVTNGPSAADPYSSRIEAFDAHGVQNCSGPGISISCTPLWTSGLMYGIGSPVVANGFIYSTGSNGKAAAWDANGSINCNGTPRVCEPVWTTTSDASSGGAQAGLMAVSGSTLVAAPVGRSVPVYGYDALGETNCTGTPKVCAPLWQTVPNDEYGPKGPPSMVGQSVFVPETDFTGAADGLQVFAAGGSTACPAAPSPCSPSWSGRLTNPTHPANASGAAVYGATAVYANRVYVPSDLGYTSAFAVDGVEGCTGPAHCEPLYSFDRYSRTPVIANGLIYLGGAAYDASGVQNCSGTPKVCTPLWVGSTPPSGDGATIVVDGRVYQTVEGKLSVYRLPS